MAAQTNAQAQAQAATQGDETAETANRVRHVNGGSTGDQTHIAQKKKSFENGVNGTPVATATRADDPGQTPKEDRAKHTSFVEMEYEEERNLSRSHAGMFTATEILQKPLLQQMQRLGQKREQENQIQKTEIREEARLLKTVMCTRMDEGLQKEEKARQMVQNDLMTIKENIRQLELYGWLWRLHRLLGKD